MSGDTHAAAAPAAAVAPVRVRVLGLVRLLVGAVFVARTTPLVGVLSPAIFFREGPLWGWPQGVDRLSVLGLGVVPPNGVVAALAVARAAAGVAFFLGVRARVAGVVAAVAGWILLASEPIAFIHTVHALHLTVLLVALGDGASELALVPDRPTSRATSVWLLRVHLAAIYAFAAFAKLDPAWLSGETLHTIARYGAVGPLGPAAFSTIERARAASWCAVAVETALPLLLLARRARIRRVGAALAFGMHLAFELTVRPDVLGLLACALLPVFLTEDDGALTARADLAA